jgi:hypothetical protein
MNTAASGLSEPVHELLCHWLRGSGLLIGLEIGGFN